MGPKTPPSRYATTRARATAPSTTNPVGRETARQMFTSAHLSLGFSHGRASIRLSAARLPWMQSICPGAAEHLRAQAFRLRVMGAYGTFFSCLRACASQPTSGFYLHSPASEGMRMGALQKHTGMGVRAPRRV